MNIFTKLRTGLTKSSPAPAPLPAKAAGGIVSKLGGGITGIFTRRKLDATSIEELEELLIEADLGAKAAAELTGALTKKRFEKDIAPEEVKHFLANEIAAILQPLAIPFAPNTSKKPAVVMMVGVNGNGKTTTMGKLAAQFRKQGLSVMLAAADTFRAAAAEQLQVWGARANVPVIIGEHESDPASVAFRAYEQAKADGIDVLMIDTAGRLQNKSNLMQELQKISRVLKKIDESAPHYVIQVLDATTGQNALSQVQTFKEMMQVTGLIITKLDGTAKGGIVVALAKQSALPIHAIGMGEGIADLKPFDASEFARRLLDIP